MPIRATPVYGPFDTGRLNGMFVIRYIGAMAAQDVQNGNMVLLIGAVSTSLTGTPARRPTVNADCFHIWRTQGDQIEDFPYLALTRYWPLIRQTYSVNQSNVLLPVS